MVKNILKDNWGGIVLGTKRRKAVTVENYTGRNGGAAQLRSCCFPFFLGSQIKAGKYSGEK